MRSVFGTKLRRVLRMGRSSATRDTVTGDDERLPGGNSVYHFALSLRSSR